MKQMDGDGVGSQITVPSYAGDKKPKAAGKSTQQQWVRVATVFAYFLCVSLAAVILVIYYGVIWEPSASGNSTKVSSSLLQPVAPCSSSARNSTAGAARARRREPPSHPQEAAGGSRQEEDVVTSPFPRWIWKKTGTREVLTNRNQGGTVQLNRKSLGVLEMNQRAPE